MNTPKKASGLLGNLQIQSALIWAAVIIACTWVTKNNDVAMILTTAAGLHVVLLSRKYKAESMTEKTYS